jgi:hypothetical protein
MTNATTPEKALKAAQFVAHIRKLQTRQTKDYLDIGRTLIALRELCHATGEFKAFLVDLKIGYRAAYDHMTVAKAVVEYDLNRNTATSIGWSKMVLLARVATPDNVDDLLEKALALTQTAYRNYTYRVRASEKGEVVEAVQLRALTFHLTKREIAFVAARFKTTGEGLSREDALLALCGFDPNALPIEEDGGDALDEVESRVAA